MHEPPSDLNMTSPESSVMAVAGKKQEVDWENLKQIVEERNGMPEPITHNRYAQDEFYN